MLVVERHHIDLHMRFPSEIISQTKIHAVIRANLELDSLQHLALFAVGRLCAIFASIPLSEREIL
jgi:hypothetical protein